MMAQKNTDAKASECQKCHNTHATMTAETIETRVTAYFTLEGGLVHQFALDIGISLLRHITASPMIGMLNKKIIRRSVNSTRGRSFGSTFALYPPHSMPVFLPDIIVFIELVKLPYCRQTFPYRIAEG
jgi:hypothetical protein